MLKNEKSANRNDHQNQKTEVFCNKNRKTDLKNSENRKTKNPNAPLHEVFGFAVTVVGHCTVQFIYSGGKMWKFLTWRGGGGLPKEKDGDARRNA